jgi:GNAT superfamily N-acetyltransferase
MRRAGRTMTRGPGVRLPSGYDVDVRPIGGSDGPLLVDAFARLSFNSRRLRFLGAKTVLTAKDVRYLTEIDHHDHEALLAVDGNGRAIGVARYVRDPVKRRVAELAIVVVDEWQRRGVGRLLVGRLAERAHLEGIHCFAGLLADDNVAVVALVRAAGSRMAVIGMDSGTVRVIVPVAPLLTGLDDADTLVGASPCVG